MADSSTAGFQNQDGAVIATGDGAATTRADYDRWGWKEIKAAIYGAAAVGKGTRLDASINLSDPRTLYNAGLNFHMAQETLSIVGKQVKAQAEALAGEGGPWQGEAAKSFLALMDQFAKSFESHAQQLRGGPARINSVPEQLLRSSDYLKWAQQTVQAIDVHYANEAKRMRPPDWLRSQGQSVVMDNGLIRVSLFPEIVQMLDADMRKVLKILAAQYEQTRFETELVPISTPNPLGAQPNPPGPGLDSKPQRLPDLVGNPKPLPELKFNGPEVPNPNGSGITPPQPFDVRTLSDLNANPFSPQPFDASGAPRPGSPGAFDGGGVPEGGSFSPQPFDASGAPRPGSPGAFDGGGVPEGGSFSPQPFDASGAPLSGVPSAAPFVPAPFSASLPPSSSGLGSGLNAPKPSSAETGSGIPKPGDSGLEPVAPFAPPALPKTSMPADWAAGGTPDGMAADDRRAAGVPGMQMMPPMAPMAPMAPMSPGAGAGAGAGERSDASGLIGGEVEPWRGAGLAGVGDPVVGSGVDSAVPERWASSSPVGDGASGVGVPGMQMMPPMAPMAPMSPGAGAGAGAGERSDASGLIGGEV
ncbi:hypothetical protein ABZV40_18805, partial [Lentzea sp. NPDC004782]